MNAKYTNIRKKNFISTFIHHTWCINGDLVTPQSRRVKPCSSYFHWKYTAALPQTSLMGNKVIHDESASSLIMTTGRSVADCRHLSFLGGINKWVILLGFLSLHSGEKSWKEKAIENTFVNTKRLRCWSWNWGKKKKLKSILMVP